MRWRCEFMSMTPSLDACLDINLLNEWAIAARCVQELAVNLGALLSFTDNSVTYSTTPRSEAKNAREPLEVTFTVVFGSVCTLPYLTNTFCRRHIIVPLTFAPVHTAASSNGHAGRTFLFA